jgi:hypothetical protein
MADLFLLEDQVHDADDAQCPMCAGGYPVRCVCGGLMHAVSEADEENETIVSTKCGKCGRSEDDLDELEEDVA